MTDMPVTPARRAMPRLALAELVLPLTVLAILVLHLSGPPGPDVAWLTTVSERILAGQQLYADILESNPPIAAFLYMPAVLLGRIFGIAPEPLIVLETVGLALASTLYSAHLVRRYQLIAQPETFAPLAFMLVGAAWGMDFAQREHFVTMALLPVAVGVAIRARGTSLPLASILIIGLCAGFASWVKPYFVLPLLGVGLFYALRLRSLRPLFWPELLIAAALFFAYWGATALLYPAYFGTLLPKLAVAYVPDRRPLWMMFIAIPASGFVGVALIALATARQHFRLSPLFPAFTVMALGLMASYLAQSKGYFYQVMPAFTFLLLAYLLAFAEANRQSARLFDKALPLGVALFFAVLPIQQLLEVWKGRGPIVAHLASYGSGRPVANISSDIGLANPAIRQVGDHFINSAPAMLTTLSAWRLRADTKATGEARERINAVEIDERATLREDFKRTPPDLFVTSQDGFDWVGWASEDPEFGAILAGYEKSADIPFFNEQVTVFRRKGLVPGG